MTEQEARAFNAGIDAALREYKRGIGAIQSLKVKWVVTVEHVGRSTKQEVKEIDAD